MPNVFRRYPSYWWLVALLAVDLLVLTSFLLDQWFSGSGWWVWPPAALVTVTAAPWLLRLADWVFGLAQSDVIVPLPGEKSPQVGWSKSEQSTRTTP